MYSFLLRFCLSKREHRL